MDIKGMECYFWGDSLGEPLRAQKKQQHSYGVLLLFLWLASGYSRFASLIPAQPLRVCLVRGKPRRYYPSRIFLSLFL
jgi:hypothetical protein